MGVLAKILGAHGANVATTLAAVYLSGRLVQLIKRRERAGKQRDEENAVFVSLAVALPPPTTTSSSFSKTRKTTQTQDRPPCPLALRDQRIPGRSSNERDSKENEQRRR